MQISNFAETLQPLNITNLDYSTVPVMNPRKAIMEWTPVDGANFYIVQITELKNTMNAETIVCTYSIVPYKFRYKKHFHEHSRSQMKQN